MTTTTIPYLPDEWQHGMKKLPAHSLCLSHVRVDGRRVCLAVPEKDAQRELRAIARLRTHIAKLEAARAKAEARRPRPVGGSSTRHPQTDRLWRPTKRHRHSRRCLVEVRQEPYRYLPAGASEWSETWRPMDAGWYRCEAKVADFRGVYELHQHRTKRGRRFLVAHVRNDNSCPDVRAWNMARAAELDAKV